MSLFTLHLSSVFLLISVYLSVDASILEQMLLLNLNTTSIENNDSTCAACQNSMENLKYTFKNMLTDKSSLKYVTDVCQALKLDNYICRKMASEENMKMIEILLPIFDTKSLCELVGQCQQEDTTQKCNCDDCMCAKVQNIKCDACVGLINFLRENVITEEFEQKVLSAVSYICRMSPVEKMKTKCEQCVAEDIPNFFYRLNTTLTVENVCLNSTFCQ